MICLAVTYTIRAGSEDTAATHFRALQELTRREPGNRGYTVYRAKDNPRKFFLYELYDDEDALAAHRAAPYFAEHGKNGVQVLAEGRDAELYEPLAPT